MNQDSTGNFDDVWDIITHYRMRKGREAVINHAVEDRVFKRLANIPPEKRGQVIDWLLENRPRNFGLDLMAIDEAVTSIRGYETAYVPAKKVTCECCGLEYQYREKSNDEDKLHRSIFERCPRCAYRAANTFHAQEYLAKNSKEEPGYIKNLEDYRADWIARGRKWWYNRDDVLLIEKIKASGTEEEKDAMRAALAAEFEKMKAQYIPWAVHSKAQAEEALQ